MAKTLTIEEMKKASENMNTIEELEEDLEKVNKVLNVKNDYNMVEIIVTIDGEPQDLEITKDNYKNIKTLLRAIKGTMETQIKDLCNIGYSLDLDKKTKEITMAGVMSTDKERKADTMSNVKK